MTNYKNARDFYGDEGFIYDSPLDELLTDEESAFLDEIIENKNLLDKVLIHLPPDIEAELAAAEDNAFIDALVGDLEEKAGRELTDAERIELENEILSGLIEEGGEQ